MSFKKFSSAQDAAQKAEPIEKAKDVAANDRHESGNNSKPAEDAPASKP